MMDVHKITLSDRVILLPPLNFKESLYLWKDASIVLTDSGGLQEETTALKVPCVTLRDNTERPITVKMGSNKLAGTRKEGILKTYRLMMSRDRSSFRIPPKWDGKSAKRIWKVILSSC
jgi:UDP-N-acetylglucosamine 2-epimerase (non-hydrolysing)